MHEWTWRTVACLLACLALTLTGCPDPGEEDDDDIVEDDDTSADDDDTTDDDTSPHDAARART